MRKQTHRMTLVFDDDHWADLLDARRLTGLGTKARTLREAVRLFAALAREREGGIVGLLPRPEGAVRITLPEPARDGLEWIRDGGQDVDQNRGDL